MPIYRYEAVNQQGKTIRGALDASSEQMVFDKLSASGYVVKSVFLPGNATPSSPAQQATARPAAQPALESYSTASIPLKRQAHIWRQASYLAKAGISSFETYQTLAYRTPGRRLSQALNDVAARVNAGSSVSEALRANEDVFGSDARYAIMAGEMGGFVADVYDDLATGMEQELTIRRRWAIYRGFCYFCLGSLLVGGSMVSFLLDKVPSVQAMEGVNTGENRTEIIAQAKTWALGVAKEWAVQFFTVTLPRVLLVVFGIPIGLSLLSRGKGKLLADKLVYMIPGVRFYKRLRLMERFSRMLGRLLGAGVSAEIAWEAAARSGGNHAFYGQMLNGLFVLKRGGKLAEAMDLSGVGRIEDIQILMTAERSGEYVACIKQMEMDYNRRAGDAARIMGFLLFLPLGILVVVWSGQVFVKVAAWYASMISEVSGWIPK